MRRGGFFKAKSQFRWGRQIQFIAKCIFLAKCLMKKKNVKFSKVVKAVGMKLH